MYYLLFFLEGGRGGGLKGVLFTKIPETPSSYHYVFSKSIVVSYCDILSFTSLQSFGFGVGQAGRVPMVASPHLREPNRQGLPAGRPDPRPVLRRSSDQRMGERGVSMIQG